MNQKELHKLLTTPDWRWGTSEGAELHTLLLGLTTTFREKLEWLEEAETFALHWRAGRKNKKRKEESGNFETGQQTTRVRGHAFCETA
jgi:hypothetical protein